jgi:hypothetical protein
VGQDEQAKIEWLKVLGVQFFSEDVLPHENDESAAGAGGSTMGAAAAVADAKAAYASLTNS